jgi:hypothetical protein
MLFFLIAEAILCLSPKASHGAHAIGTAKIR